MGLRVGMFLLAFCILVLGIAADTNNQDYAALMALTKDWDNLPPGWKTGDPCGSNWEGISCTKSHITSITLSSLSLKGRLTGDLVALSELQILDLSYNPGLRGTLPQDIGKLTKLTNLILVGCSFLGTLPDSIGSLQQLVFLSLNSNSFTGDIPPSIGNLKNLYWLDLSDNQLSGNIPVSDGTTPGLDLLVNTKHFHFGQNQLTGTIPPSLFGSQMELLHVLFDNNQLTGSIPSSLALVQTLEAVRFDRNSLSGALPSNLNNLTHVNELILSNNRLSGTVPDLEGMSGLNYLDMSNNSFEVSEVPEWFSTLQSLTTVMMEQTGLQGEIPAKLFSFPQLQTVILKNNKLNGTLDIGASYSGQLQLIDLQNNSINGLTVRQGYKFTLILADNPFCQGSGSAGSYCNVPQLSSSSYSTPLKGCAPVRCTSGRTSSPSCKCAYPYAGTLIFRAPSFSNLGNLTLYVSLEKTLMETFQDHILPVDSVSLSNATRNKYGYLGMFLEIFPANGDHFDRTAITLIGFMLSNQTYKPPPEFGPYVFIANSYSGFGGQSKSSQTGIIVGTTVGGSVLLLLLISAGVYAYHQKRRAESATRLKNPFVSWDSKKSGGDIPQLKGSRFFSFEEVKRCTNNFSEANNIGSGGYGKVYKGVLGDGQVVAIKRAQEGSMQGSQEFKTEIELLSRVHHKNLVNLIGFCFDQGEQMLVYEFIPNGTLMESLSGKSRIRLDWKRRLRVALGSAQGLAYLHELADPPIIHRDIKSNNILLDERLNAKVSDFGLSKPFSDSEKGYVTTQVKGTLGYLDPEYYMTQQLTEKSDVFSFGVVMLEMITGRRPILQGRYVVKEIKTAIDRTKDLYNIHELLDPTIVASGTLVGFERFVNLALRCVEDSGPVRPAMGEVVKEIESILQLAGMNPNTESGPTSDSYEEASSGTMRHPYSVDSLFDYSGSAPPSKIEPQ